MNPSSDLPDAPPRTPRWVFALILILSVLDPLTHVRIASTNSRDRVHTGLHKTDSAIFLHSMNMFSSGYYSPYAGDHSADYFPAPFHWFYGILGAAADLIRADHFLFLGVANGLGLAAYLYAAFRFLVRITPLRAGPCFLFFACSGGLGGAAFLLSRALGMDEASEFELYFRRFSMYELVEGPYLFPWLYSERLYYSASLALCFAGLSAHVDALRMRCNAHSTYAGIPFFAGGLINFRFALMAFAIAALYELASNRRTPLRHAIPVALGIGAATVLSYAVMARNPGFISNTGDLVRETMWLTPFLSTAALLLAPLVPALVKNIRAMSGISRIFAEFGAYYLIAFAVLFTGYQFYHGNLLIARDSAAPLAVSDWALPLAGIATALRWRAIRRIPHCETSDTDTVRSWLTLWFLAFTAAAISAFGQGWFIQFTPQRFMVFLGIPMAVLAVQGLDGARHPAFARQYRKLVVVAGICSIAASSLFFQGPLIDTPGRGAFAWLHPEWMTPADAELLDAIPSGRVLAPYLAADAIGMRPNLITLGGAGAADLAGLRSVELQPRIDAFFRESKTPEERAAFLTEWDVNYVFCPDTWPLDAEVQAEFSSHPELHLIAQVDMGTVYRYTHRPGN